MDQEGGGESCRRFFVLKRPVTDRSVTGLRIQIFILHRINGLCRPYTFEEAPECGRIHPHSNYFPDRQLAFGEGQPRCYSAYGGNSFHPHRERECPGGGPAHHPNWSSCPPQNISAGGGTKPPRRCSSPSDRPGRRSSIPAYAPGYPESERNPRCWCTASANHIYAVLRFADHDHLLLFKLVDAVNAALLNAMRADFLAKARGIAGQGLRQLGLLQRWYQ